MVEGSLHYRDSIKPKVSILEIYQRQHQAKREIRQHVFQDLATWRKAVFPLIFQVRSIALPSCKILENLCILEIQHQAKVSIPEISIKPKSVNQRLASLVWAWTYYCTLHTVSSQFESACECVRHGFKFAQPCELQQLQSDVCVMALISLQMSAVYAFLFTDMLLITKPNRKASNKYTVIRTVSSQWVCGHCAN